MTEPAISLVIPVFNGEDILAVSLERVSAFFDCCSLDAEVIVVGDRTLAESRIEAGQPLQRRISTRVFSFSVRTLVTDELHTIADQRYWTDDVHA